MGNKIDAPVIYMEDVVEFILMKLHDKNPDERVSKTVVEMVLGLEEEFLIKKGIIEKQI